MLDSGDLYIRDTTEHDGSYSFRCHTENVVTKEKKVSMNFSRIIITGKIVLYLLFYKNLQTLQRLLLPELIWSYPFQFHAFLLKTVSYKNMKTGRFPEKNV